MKGIKKIHYLVGVLFYCSPCVVYIINHLCEPNMNFQDKKQVFIKKILKRDPAYGSCS